MWAWEGGFGWAARAGGGERGAGRARRRANPQQQGAAAPPRRAGKRFAERRARGAEDATMAARTWVGAAQWEEQGEVASARAVKHAVRKPGQRGVDATPRLGRGWSAIRPSHCGARGSRPAWLRSHKRGPQAGPGGRGERMGAQDRVGPWRQREGECGGSLDLGSPVMPSHRSSSPSTRRLPDTTAWTEAGKRAARVWATMPPME